jgi:hypothetical protein
MRLSEAKKILMNRQASSPNLKAVKNTTDTAINRKVNLKIQD